MNYSNLSFDEASKIVRDEKMRRALAKESHLWFFNLYLPHYISYPIADFHREMFKLTEDKQVKIAQIIAFRNSAKSTIMTLSYPIWSIIGKQQKKFVVILSQTHEQAKFHLLNIKREMESNELLKNDLGPFREDTNEWGVYSLLLPWHDAKIVALSISQSLRGARYRQFRPDLIICDDLEDLASVKTKESRDKIYNQLTGEIFPAGQEDTKFMIVGNLLHEDSVMMRIKNGIKQKLLNGTVLEIPLIDDNGQIAWPGKFPDQASIEAEKKKIGSEISWMREYLLKIIPEEGQEIRPEWIHYYDQIPHDKKKYRHTLTGVDPAASQKDHADFTAIVSARIFGYGEELKIVILPNPINKKIDFPESIKELQRLYDFKDGGKSRRILVEGFGYQKVLAQMLRNNGIPAEETTPLGLDKRARLRMTSELIARGVIVFPMHGAEELINQLVYFGAEKYDDLVDAFTLVVYKALEEMKKPATPEIFFVGGIDNFPSRRGLSEL